MRLILLPVDKILYCSKLKVFADKKTNENFTLVLGWVENILRKGENAGSFFSLNVFKRLLSYGRKKSVLCGKWLFAFAHL